jgi:hypothetical protein
MSLKKKRIKWPRIKFDKAIMVVGSARPMKNAARVANVEFVLWMEKKFGFSR